MVKKITATTAFKTTALETSHWLPWQKPDSTWAWKLIRLDDGRMEQSSRVWRCGRRTAEAVRRRPESGRRTGWIRRWSR